MVHAMSGKELPDLQEQRHDENDVFGLNRWEKSIVKRARFKLSTRDAQLASTPRAMLLKPLPGKS